MREYLRTPELELRLVNPRFHEGRLCRATARTSTPMRLSGAGRERSHWQSVPGEQGGGAGEGRQIPGRAVQPERRGETALPDGPAIKGRNTPARLPPRFPAPGTRQMHIPPWLWFSWDISEDGLTYTFRIPEGVQWTDGIPLTTADVVFSLDRMVQEGENRPRAGALRTYYVSSEAIGPQIVAVNLKFPAAAFLPALGIDYMKVVPKHVVGAGTDIGDVAPQVGSGPYEMVSYRKGDVVEYERNENYFKDGLPLLDGITKHVITDKGRTKAAFETRQVLMATVGFTGMNVQDYLNLQESAEDHLTVHFMNDFLAIGLILNTTIPPYDNPKVRRALFLAADRQAQVDAFGFGKGSIHGPMPSWLWFGMPEEELLEVPGFRQTADGKKDPRDIEMAKQLLAEAGYPDGFDATITVRQTGIYADQAALLKDQFREIGINITTRPLESTAGFAAFLALDFEMGIQGTGFAFHDPDQILAGLYLPRGARNYPGWEHPMITELYDQQARATDRTKRGEIISEIEQILLYEDNHWVGLLWDNFGWPVSKRIKDFYMPATVASTGMMWERIWLDE